MKTITKERIAFSMPATEDNFIVTWNDIENSSIGKIWMSDDFYKGSDFPLINIHYNESIREYSLEVIHKNDKECICVYGEKRYYVDDFQEKKSKPFKEDEICTILFEF